MTKLIYEELKAVDGRFILEECISIGVFSEVHRANDTTNKDKKVAVKIQKFLEENEHFIREEYGVLHEFCDHLNLPDFFGVFKNFRNENREIWFIMELCEGGPVIDLVNKLLQKNRRMAEEHIGFIIKEVVKALTYLHKNHIIHRNVRGNNILMTTEGEIKLVGFELSHHLNSTLSKTDTSLGSPYWMAPEVVTSTGNQEEEKYGNRADVWAVGITAIELGDGKTPFRDMHPTRALFQIVRNPPPTLYRPANWSEEYNDFISECLVKNPEHRPFMEELQQHPFLTAIPENNYHLTQELKTLRQNLAGDDQPIHGHDEGIIYRNFVKKSIDTKPERTLLEDLVALNDLNEDSILEELEARMSLGLFQTFIGDVLIILNPNELQNIYSLEIRKKYNCKSRSDNAPHIYAVADSAYQHAIHHILPQNILLLGESGSGKTTNFLHLITHLLHLGENNNINIARIMNGVKLLQAFTHSATPINNISTRSIFKVELIYGRSGKITGAIFNVLQLEKLKTDQSNFHILRFIYDGLLSSKNLDRYHLEAGGKYNYLSTPTEATRDFDQIEATFEEYEFTAEQVETVRCILAAVILIGEVEYAENETIVIINEEQVLNAAELLKVDGKKLVWALTNFRGLSRKRPTYQEAKSAKEVLANNLYSRLIDYIVNNFNHKLSFGRAIFGEHYSIRIYDMFGFECLKENHLQQLFVNAFNEQMHYLYLQRIFAWEALETNEENLPFTPIYYYDNKSTIEEILGKQGGVFTYIDDATKNCYEGEHITNNLENKEPNKVKFLSKSEFSIAHYPGRVTYNVEEMPKQNRNFLPSEVIEVLCQSNDPIVKQLFTAKLNKTGNIVVKFDEQTIKDQNKFSSSSSEDVSLSEGLCSQANQTRTVSATYRSVCLELLKELSVGGSTGGTHFVLCIRSDFENKPRAFHSEIIRQQIRALTVLETAKARQKGYPHRIMCPEFLRRYKLLAFGFDENVEITRDNCRLLLVRLKMEGWMIGKTKVFLKYYNEEYLTRLHETQIRKVVKIQCMMRSFLVRRKLAKKIQRERERTISQLRKGSQSEMTPEEAAIILQKAYRGITARKIYGPLVSKTGKLDEETRDFIKHYSNKWKSKSLFQVILQYRAAKCHDFFNLSQQVHFFNQKIVHNLHHINKDVDLNYIEPNAQANVWLDDMRPPVLKLPFRLDEIPYFDTSYMCDPGSSTRITITEDAWDSAFQWRENLSSQITSSLLGHEQEKEIMFDTDSRKLIDIPYNRDPQIPVQETTTEDSQKLIQELTPIHSQKSVQELTIKELAQDIATKDSQKLIQEKTTNDLQTFILETTTKKLDQDTTAKNSQKLSPELTGSDSQNLIQETSVNKPQKLAQEAITSDSQKLVCQTTSKNSHELVQETNTRSPQKLILETSTCHPQKTDASSKTEVATTIKAKINDIPPETAIIDISEKDREMKKKKITGTKHPLTNPIAELQHLARRLSGSEDDPPFDFQSMLRKTNIQRNSLKRTFSSLQVISRRQSITENDSVSMEICQRVLQKHGSVDELNTRTISMEVAPGIFMEGLMTDL